MKLRLLLLALVLARPLRAAAAPAPAPAPKTAETEAAEEEAGGDEADEDAAAGDEEDDGEGARSMQIGVRGSRGREANTRDYDWGPTVSLEIMQSRKEKSNRFKYELEASYNDAATSSRSGDTSQSTRVRTAEFRYAKLSLLELHGYDLRKRLGIVPYVAGGVQHVDSIEDSTSRDEETGEIVSERARARYWSPSFGIGAEVALNKRLKLSFDYDRNVASGDRLVERLTLELKFAVFGGDE